MQKFTNTSTAAGRGPPHISAHPLPATPTCFHGHMHAGRLFHGHMHAGRLVLLPEGLPGRLLVMWQRERCLHPHVPAMFVLAPTCTSHVCTGAHMYLWAVRGTSHVCAVRAPPIVFLTADQGTGATAINRCMERSQWRHYDTIVLRYYIYHTTTESLWVR